MSEQYFALLMEHRPLLFLARLPLQLMPALVENVRLHVIQTYLAAGDELIGAAMIARCLVSFEEGALLETQDLSFRIKAE